MEARPLSRRRLRFESAAVGLAVFAPLLVAIHQFALGWDEGYTFERQDALRPWLAKLVDPQTRDRGALFSKPVLSEHWRFSREEPDGHGPVYALLSLAGQAITGSFLQPPASYRVGGIALFSLTIGCVYGSLQPRWGALASLVTVGLLATVPRIAPEICYALIDGPLLCFSILAWTAFVRAVDSSDPSTTRVNNESSGPALNAASPWTTGILFGLAVGLAMGTKLTGWFLPAPYIAWALWRRRREAFITLGVGAVIALTTVFAVNVGWWPDPIDGIRRYFVSNLTRAETIAIPTRFWGQQYRFALPWYNTLVWTVVAMPVGTLLFGIVGIVSAFWKRAPLGVLLLLNWGLLMVVRAMPQAPGHDGTRQILIAFGFLALLAGYGFAALWSSRSVTERRWAKGLVVALGLAAVGESAISNVRYHPLQLSYYSPIVGGLPGAARLGFEPTYFWDAVTPEVLDWINMNTGPGEWVLFRNNPRSWDYLARWGKLRANYRPGPGLGPNPKWVIVQNRPGIFLPSDERLLRNGTPVFRKEFQGVPLIGIYPYEQFAEANRATD